MEVCQIEFEECENMSLTKRLYFQEDLFEQSSIIKFQLQQQQQLPPQEIISPITSKGCLLSSISNTAQELEQIEELSQQLLLSNRLEMLLNDSVLQIYNIEQEYQIQLQKCQDQYKQIKYLHKLIGMKQSNILSLSNVLESAPLSQHETKEDQFLKLQQQIVKEIKVLDNLKQTIQGTKDDVLVSTRSIKDLDTISNHLGGMILQNAEEYLSHKGNMRIVCRVRPFQKLDINLESNNYSRVLQVIDDYSVQLCQSPSSPSPLSSTTYSFMKVFDEESSQISLFQDLNFFLRAATSGENVCVFTYGPTGSGKTWTMFGDVNSAENKGIIPRSIEQICLDIESLMFGGYNTSIEIVVVEIYNNKIKKLSSNEQNLSMEIPKQVSPNQAAKKLKEIVISSSQNRIARNTQCNSKSSRSHLIISILINSAHPNKAPFAGSLTLVDLAGSEKITLSKVTGEALKEAQFINASLSTLSQVIRGISRGDTHIPYRNSMLTQYLREKLTSNSKTMMILNVSASSKYYFQTKDTLFLSAPMFSHPKKDKFSKITKNECPITEQKQHSKDNNSSKYSVESLNTVKKQQTNKNYSLSFLLEDTFIE